MTDDETMADEADSEQEPDSEDDSPADETSSEEEPPGGDDESERTRLLANKPVLVATAFAVVAFLAATVLGGLWWSTTSSGTYRIAEARDDVTAAATEAIGIFTEIDPADPDKHTDRKRELATGEFFQAWEQDWESLRESIVETEISVRTTVREVAVTELNEHEGNAAVIAVIEVTESPVGPVLWRLQTQLQRVDGDWKLSDLVLWPSPQVP